MKIAVLCASGKAGKLIVEEAINKSLEVSAFVRNSNKARFDSKVYVVQKDIFTLESSVLQGFDVIKASKGINWVYVSPPAVFIPDAPKSGKYKIIGEEFEVNSKGKSKISYADYAIAMIEIALDSTYSKQRVGVIGL